MPSLRKWLWSPEPEESDVSRDNTCEECSCEVKEREGTGAGKGE